MESRFSAGDRTVRTIRNCLLPDRKTSVCRCPAWPWRILPNSGSVAGSQRRACQKSNIAAAGYNPDAVAAVCDRRTKEGSFRKRPRRLASFATASAGQGKPPPRASGGHRRAATIQTRRTRSRFFTGIAFVFCGSDNFSSEREATRVPAPHKEKQDKTIATFAIKFTD